MRTLLLCIALATVTGCPCGAYQGAGDQVYARGSDQMILCSNGGYSIAVAGKTLEGFFTENTPGSTYLYVGTDGPTGTHAFDLAVASDGTATSSDLGAGAWQRLSLDKTALDHADTLCQGLETRSWFTAR